MYKLFHKIEFKIFLTFFLIFCVFIQWNGWNENSRFALTRAIVDEGRLEIDSFANQTSDRSFFQGHYYSDKDPGTSLIASIPYSIFKVLFHQNYSKTSQIYFTNHVGNVEIYDILNLDDFTLYSMILVTIFTSVIFSALTVVLIYKISDFFTTNKNNRLVITFAAGLATTIFPYALVFLENATATFFALLGFYLLLKKKYKKVDQKKYSLFSGLSFGLATISSVITLVIFIVSIGYIWNLKKRHLKIFILGFLTISSIYLIYNTLIFKTPFTLPRQYLDSKIWNQLGGIYGLNTPNPYVILRLLFDPFKGIFFYYPILLLSIYGLYLMYKKMKAEAILIILIFVFIVILNSSWWAWWGGTTFGPRHLTYMVPFFVLPLIFIIDKKSKFVKILFFILLTYSIFINFVSLQPKIDEIIGPDKINMAVQYESKINSFEIFSNPIYDYYIPNFIQTGPRSRILENLISNKPLDIRFLGLEEREYSLQFYDHIQFIPLLLVVVIIILFFYEETVIVNKKLVIIIILIILSVSLTSFIIKRFNNQINFYQGCYFPTIENRVWTSNDAKIILNEVKEDNYVLSFVSAGFEKDKNVFIKLNGQFLDKITIFKNQEMQYNLILPKLKFDSEIEFYTSDKCIVPIFANKGNDTRCLGFYFRNVTLNKLNNFFTLNNWYPKSPIEDWVWMENNGTIFIYNEEMKPIGLKIILGSYNNDRTLIAYVNDNFYGEFKIPKNGTEIALSVKIDRLITKVQFYSPNNCQIPKELNVANDTRCLSISLSKVRLV